MTARRLPALATLAMVLVLVAFAPAAAAGAAQITIVNTDGPNEGFNDPTAATPVGGNTGTTVGQQRLIAFERAAEIWGELLDTPVEIRVRATFDPLPCTADEGALGGAFPDTVVSDSPDAPLAGAWYPSALANKFAGTDLVPGSDDITARFNSSVGQTGCLEDGSWYYGLDAQHGTGFDLVAVLLHELGHGLGFLTLVDDSTGSEFLNQPDIFESMIFDESVGKHWTDMTAAERAVSDLNTGHVLWDGAAVTAQAPGVLGPMLVLTVDAPASIAGDLDFGTAAFGPDLSEVTVSGQLVQAIDAADIPGPATTDGCSAYSNASAVHGHIALADRGDCLFVEKAANAQTAGATALVVVDNVIAAQPPGMAGDDPTITIPVISVTQADGATLKANLGAGVHVRIGVNPGRLAGTGSLGRLRLYAPNPAEPGSSISHWDTSATPNLLMEPNLSGDLPHTVDLTLPLLHDIGWSSDSFPEPQPREAPERAGRERATREVTDRP